MKRCYDHSILFRVILPDSEYEMIFSSDWKFIEMLDWMLDSYPIDPDFIVEIQQTFIRKYKLIKDGKSK